jgi:hypothetical protein
MDDSGNYTIKEWVDPNKDYELDGLIFEIFKNEQGRYQLLQWTEEEIIDMVEEMFTFKDEDKFWDQVIIGYTDMVITDDF